MDAETEGCGVYAYRIPTSAHIHASTTRPGMMSAAALAEQPYSRRDAVITSAGKNDHRNYALKLP